MRMTTFIIGIIIAAAVMTGYGLVLTDANTTYNAEYNPDDMETFEKMEQIDNLTSNIKTRVENQTTDRSLTDVIGGFIADGKDTLLLSAQSFGLFESMASEGMEKTHIPNVFKTALFAIIIIILFIGIILAAILGRRL